ncbi:DOPA 4,5-dioxygenase family protein [Vibrio sp. SCSIO 43136]|uniref:DOPA 4,5-dioxygenase family protein n=1 Tax=Vibrio sp. SCSIO 43136 TaxID=2819101 RepID=UPI00207508BB|nr:DOPA 4,5-dioxygenase family protein [Vibrio sp. SCSIO 43136]USD66885.1 DOPA 4,5-dioxygenase family protein [Vibrio sp. SCSIO 43136]
MPQRPVNQHSLYHAHVYFDQSSLNFATQLCEQVGQRFGLPLGTINQRPVGPHTVWSCQILFKAQDFERLVPWLDDNRGDLTVFIHGVTGDDLKDHTEYAYWLGEEVALDLSGF